MTLIPSLVIQYVVICMNHISTINIVRGLFHLSIIVRISEVLFSIVYDYYVIGQLGLII